jgi:3-oxoacyl-[acyl-carrier-protein] synthase-3
MLRDMVGGDLYILGAGAALPEQVLSDAQLAELGLTLAPHEQQLAARTGVQGRRTSLPLEYLSTSRNRDILEGRARAAASPTALGVQAVQQALTRAGITIEQVGLIVGDSCTPYQTCPAEAHRIGGALGVKVAAYDVVAGPAGLGVHLDMLAAWQPARLPEYVLCVSTHTPTQQLHFDGLAQGGSGALAAYLLGDAAAALVVSARHAGRLRIEWLRQRREGGAVTSAFSAPRQMRCTAENFMSAAAVQQLVATELSAMRQSRAQPLNDPFVIGPQLYAAQLKGGAAQLGCVPERVVVAGQDTGYAFGASAGCGLAGIWDTVQPGDAVVWIDGGDGAWCSGVFSRL